MTLFVVVVNLAITLVNCYLVWKLWQWRSAIAIFTRTVQHLEQQFDLFFRLTPKTLNVRRETLRDWRDCYQTLSLSLLRLQQILFLLRFFARFRFPLPRQG